MTRHSGTQKNLAVHLRSHSGEKQYHSNFFGISFSDSSYFIRHMRAHIGENTKIAATVTNHLQKKIMLHYEII